MAGASKYLANLPSRGLFSSSALSSNTSRMRVYVCDHDTSPPEEQHITTDSMNILIRSLQLNKQKSELKESRPKASSLTSRSKRSSERSIDGRTTAKRAAMGSDSGSCSRDAQCVLPSQQELESFTVDRLRTLLKERGLSAKGKKDELISRLKEEDL